MKNNKGVVLILVIIFNVILSLTGLAFLYMSSNERIFVQDEVQRYRALYVAEAGFERAKSWLQCLSQDQKVAGEINPFNGEVIFEPIPAAAQGKYSVSIVPDSGNSGKVEKLYVVTSSGSVGNVIKVIKARIKIVNFARFAFFSDMEYPGGATHLGNNWKDRIWTTTADIFSGPVHSNDELSICGQPQFSKNLLTGRYEVSTSSDIFYFNCKQSRTDGGTGDPLNLPSGLYPKVDRINMFKDWNLARLKSVAQTKSGLVLVGDQNIVLYNTYLTHNGASWPIPSEASTSAALVFVTGNVTIKSNKNISGEVTKLQRYLTIVSSGSSAANGKMFVTGSINVDTNTLSSEGMLGLVASNDIIVNVPVSENQVAIQAIMMTYKSFWADGWDTKFKPPTNPTAGYVGIKGEIDILGGLIQGVRSCVGQAYASSYASDLKTGYKKNFVYDKRVLNRQPPYFPRYFEVKPFVWWEEPMKRI
ncbi:MAG: pilus assembly PilX N-terminal domain-containing protein [Elusimicrobiota bacterium]